MSGKVVIFSGPSGVGKDTVLEAWQALDPRVTRVIAWTTRQPRTGEESGIDYHFCEVAEFERKAAANHFLEYKNVHGHWYATPLDQLQDLQERGQIAVLKIDVQGALTAMKLLPQALSIFLLPPSDEELERRLRSRKTEDEETILRRLTNARMELGLADQYHFRVINDNIERAVDEIQSIVEKN
ncbi:MAG: guanylate kinase [Fimbriimonadaceae bacterium]|nr:guanylate kinase [Fimbriimonadaceae bacterium]